MKELFGLFNSVSTTKDLGKTLVKVIAQFITGKLFHMSQEEVSEIEQVKLEYINLWKNLGEDEEVSLPDFNHPINKKSNPKTWDESDWCDESRTILCCVVRRDLLNELCEEIESFVNRLG